MGKVNSVESADGDRAGALVVRYVLLLALGFAGLFLMLLSMTAAIQIVALGAGFGRHGVIRAGAWGLALMMTISALPMLRFSIADMPNMVTSLVRDNRRRAVILLLVAGCGYCLVYL